MGEASAKQVCRDCGVTKPLDQFTVQRRARSGRGSYCKPCHNLRCRLYAERNPDKVRASKDAYIAANRDEIRRKGRERARMIAESRPPRDPKPPAPPKAIGPCSISECGKAVFARGWCNGHYKRWRKYGNPQGAPPSRKKSRKTGINCEVEACESAVFGKGLCSAHHYRLHRYGDPLAEPPPRKHPGPRGRRRPERKDCTACKRNLPASAFGEDRANVTTLRSQCKECDRLRQHRNRMDREVHNAKARRWYAGNKEAIKERVRRRNAQCSRPGFTSAELDQRMSMFGYKCWICKTADFEHVDHVKPIARGGLHILANLRPACAQCNFSKNARWPFDPSMINQAVV